MSEHGRVAQGEVGDGGEVFDLTAGDPSLDFVNTLSGRGGKRPVERLRRYQDLVSWGRQAGLLSAADAARLRRRAAGRRTEAQEVLERAIALREALYRVFCAAARRGRPDPADLAVLNEALPGVLSRLRLEPAQKGFAWRWSGDEEALDPMLWPVARRAAALLTSADLESVRECSAPECCWLFLDRSRNRSRRWCDMRVCGNRAKARRHYRRTKGGERAIP